MGYYLDETTFTDQLIAFLLSCKSNSIRKSILWERVKKRRNISNNIFYQNMYRLRKKGYILSKDEKYQLSNKGKSFYMNTCRKIYIKNKKYKKIIIIFDIPERNKKVREWIRRQIKFWDFKMIQKSVWIGYGPLPDEFKNRLKILKVDGGVKILDVEKK